MPRYCFTLQVRPDRLDAYRQLHREVWPEMLDALRRNGWRDYHLFLRDDGLLIGFVQTDDLAAAIQRMQAEPINARWQEQVQDLFDALPAAAADTSMQPLEPVFHLP